MRSKYVKDIFWQFLVLIITIWTPVLIIFSHFYYFFESRHLPYHLGIFNAIWLNFSISTLKNPCSKIWAILTWIFLLFIIVLIFADMASIIASSNISNNLSFSSIVSLNTCSTISSIITSNTISLDNCLQKLSNGDVDAAIIGKLELFNLNTEEYKKFIIYDNLRTEIFFHLMTKPGNNSQYDYSIQKLWNNQIIPQIYSNYSNLSYKTFSRYSLVFQEFEIILVGISILVIFIAIIAFRYVFYKPLPIKEAKDEEPSPSSRSLLSRNPSHTISLDQSVNNRLSGEGRPEEWVNRAVDINDENAHKIKNIQDYENELSAVNPAAPSFGSEKSLISLMKLTKK